jgi:formiminotetrahydrofolate cyclodeaminase
MPVMSDSLWNLSLRDALLATAGPSPTPGGGSIAPVGGAFGLSLMVMALEVTNAKQASDSLGAAIGRGRALLDVLAAHADRDVLVFQTYMHALSLPKADAAQQSARRDALQGAVLEAARVPLAAAESCLAALEYGESIGALVQRNVVSDLIAGADMLLGALKAVLRSVDINLPVLRDEDARRQLGERAAQVAARAEEVYERVCATAKPVTP